jgi:hypothetical protein
LSATYTNSTSFTSYDGVRWKITVFCWVLKINILDGN